METNRFTYLFHKYTSLTASEAESNEFVAMAAQPGYHSLLQELSQRSDVAENQAPEMDGQSSRQILQSIFDMNTAEAGIAKSHIAPVHRIHFLKTSWFRYAAAVIVLIAGTAVFLTQYYFTTKELIAGVVRLTPTDISAGGNKAILTLADGTTISLDSSFTGNIAQQGNASIMQMPNGELRYELNGVQSGELLMNKMSVPKGGQYRLTLPDGTMVWLNAASSITYPAAFGTGARKITLSGEAYFEVAQERSRPFTIDVDGAGEIEVLGTSFNVNAYKDYNAIRTTLVSGKIRVAVKNSMAVPDKKAIPVAVVLSPGQQAVQGMGSGAAGSLRVVESVDLSQVLAWKNGIFDFNGADFQTIMKEVERWYDVNIKYEGAIPDIRFRGKMDRAVKLSGVIRILKANGIQARLSEQTLIIKGE